MSHWAEEFLGKPWLTGGRGPEAFDCWGLLYWVYKYKLGIELPLYPTVLPGDPTAVASAIHRGVTHGTETGEWSPLAKPVDLCAVAMSTRKVFHHVGIFAAIDGGLVIHAADYKSVVAQSLTGLRLRGYRRIEFFRHGQHH